jgi:hypothetical protein
VVFQVANVSDQPRRVVGAANECVQNVCYKFKLEDPITIAPGKTDDIACELSVSGDGPFEVSMLLYLEDEGIRQVPLSVRGVGEVVPLPD